MALTAISASLWEDWRSLGWVIGEKKGDEERLGKDGGAEEKRRERKRFEKKGQAEMKIGVGKGDWRDSSNLKKLGAIYTKEVLWPFNRSIIQHISSLLSSFFPSQPNSLFPLNEQK